MPIDPKLVVWLVATFMAVICLARLMRNRQKGLLLKLSQYVEQQREWSKKRAKATRLAQKLAREKADIEARETRKLGPHDYDRYDKNSSSVPAGDAPQRQPAQEAA